jgi:L-threonylcarbamoyladenylate synthase
MIFHFYCNKGKDLKKCASLIDDGAIVIFPTDTVYGIGCDPLNDDSVLKLFKIKRRPLDKYLPILTNDVTNLSQIVEVTEEAKILIDHFWPGQITLILKLLNNSLASRYAFDKTIAIRIPNNSCTTNLIKMTKNKLLVGTSANLSEHHPFTNINDLKNSHLQGYDAIVYEDKERIRDGEKVRIGGGRAVGGGVTEKARGTSNSSIPISTIVDLVEINNPKIKREGIIPKEKIFATLKENLL